MKHLIMFLFAAAIASAENAVPKDKHVSVEWKGDGKPGKVLVHAVDVDAFGAFDIVYAGQTLHLEGSYISDGDDQWPEIKAVNPLPDSRVQWLKVNGSGDGITDSTCSLIGFKNGKLAVMASFKGAEVTIPGNGTILTDVYLGFWSRKTKWVIDAKGALTFVPQEFYAVGSTEVLVKKTFGLKTTKGTDTVVARPREGSLVEIVLWQGELPVTETKLLPPNELEKAFEEPGWLKGWYLIRTETGLMGWVKGAGLGEYLELHIAG